MHIVAKDFDLKHTIESAQPLAFFGHYKSTSNADYLEYATQYSYISIKAEIIGNKTYNISAQQHGYCKTQLLKEVKSRLGLNDDIKKIYNNIETDKFMRDAVRNFYGMRVTLNDPWETTLSFIVSQFNNIKRIRGIMLSIINKFGEPENINGKNINFFPGPKALAKASQAQLKACGAGFRSKYIVNAATAFAEGSFDSLHKMKYQDAKNELMKCSGIGDKVADCILLMGYKKLEAFPIDTWIARVLEKEYYSEMEKTKEGNITINEMHRLASSKWGSYAGYAEQYLFWHGRSIGIAERKSRQSNKAGVHKNINI
jgi:N-glycosylase/DNA lyase